MTERPSAACRRWLRLFLRGFRRSTGGSIAIITAFALVALTTVTGMAVDLARFAVFRMKMQQLADSATIAAASDSANKTEALLAGVATSYLAANPIPPGIGTVAVQAMTYDSAAKSFEVNLTGTMNTTFLRIAGYESVSTAVRSRVLRAMPGPLEMALTLDLTTSMSFTFTPGTTKLQALKNASTVLINELMEYNDVRIALVPFGQHVMVGTSFDFQSWLNTATRRSWDTWRGCVGVRPDPHRPVISNPTSPGYPYIYPVACAAPIVPLTDSSNKTQLLNSVGSAFTQVATFIPAGLLWAWNVLSSDAPYVEGRSRAQMQALGGRKVVVLMAEGDNNVAARASGDTSTATATELATITNPLMSQLCTNMKADGIQIYVVAILGTTPPGQTLLQGCASSADHFYYAGNPQALTDAFRDISSKMVQVRLVN